MACMFGLSPDGNTARAKTLYRIPRKFLATIPETETGKFALGMRADVFLIALTPHGGRVSGTFEIRGKPSVNGEREPIVGGGSRNPAVTTTILRSKARRQLWMRWARPKEPQIEQEASDSTLRGGECALLCRRGVLKRSISATLPKVGKVDHTCDCRIGTGRAISQSS
jgi:hypothetical protein